MYSKASLITLLLALFMPLHAQDFESFAKECDSSYYNTGITVWDLTTDSLLWSYNGQKVMRPASTQKLFTAVAALDQLTAQHEYRTRILHTGDVTEDSLLNGDIYIVGDFDPTLKYGDIRFFAKQIKDFGINRINGTIYADASMKESTLYGNGWCWDDVPCNNMPYLSPLMYERGSLYPDFKSYSTDLYFNPPLYFAQTISNELKDLGVFNAQGDSTSVCADLGKAPADSCYEIFVNSITIGQALQHMMKTSDNLYAESMFYHLGFTWKEASQRVLDVIRKTGADASRVKVADGSGVSLYNYSCADTEVALLRYAFQNPSIYTYLYHSLPIAGMDGTLEKRMISGPAFGNVHAKTGTVTGCSCLAGYVTASNGHILAFSIMNNGVMTASVGRNFQDRLCQELAK